MVVVVDYIAADKPSHSAAYHHIRGEMLSAQNSGQAYAGGEPIRSDLGERSAVFRGDHGCRGPGDDAVVRRERGVGAHTGLEKLALGIITGGPLAERHEFHDLGNSQAIQNGFPDTGDAAQRHPHGYRCAGAAVMPQGSWTVHVANAT